MKPRIIFGRQSQHKTALSTLRIRKRRIPRLPQHHKRAMHHHFVVGHFHMEQCNKKEPLSRFFFWSDRRDSNPRPRRPERRALPTALRSDASLIRKNRTPKYPTHSRSCEEIIFCVLFSGTRNTEGSHSGLVRTPGTRVCRKASRVRISPLPPEKDNANALSFSLEIVIILSSL